MLENLPLDAPASSHGDKWKKCRSVASQTCGCSANERQQRDEREARKGSARQRDGQSGSRNRRVTAALGHFFHERGGFRFIERAGMKKAHGVSD